MNFESDRDDLIEIVDFIEQLLNELVGRVPEQRAQYRRVWRSNIQPKIKQLRDNLSNLSSTTADWAQLSVVGLSGEDLRLKYDGLESAVNKGFLSKVFGFVETLLESFTHVFDYLEALKEFVGFLRQSFLGEPEPAPYIQTLFGKGPIPTPPSESDTKPQGRKLKL